MFRNRILTSYLTTHGWVEKKQIEFHGQIAFAWCNCAGVHGFGKAILLNIVHCNTTLHIMCVNHKCGIYTGLWNHKGNQSIAITSDLPRKWTQWKVFNYAHKRPIQVSNIQLVTWSDEHALPRNDNDCGGIMARKRLCYCAWCVITQ